jgi:predicted NBD/HSP70 family sugar kinase
MEMVRIDVGQRSETVRRANLSSIARELHAHGPLSRSELVTATGLTRSAIRGLIGEFVAAGLVTEERAAPLGTPGRPSTVVRLRPEQTVVLALEISVDSIAAAIVGLGGVVLARARAERPRGHTSVDDIVADLAALVAELEVGHPWRQASIGIGVAVVGVVRRTDGCVSMAPNLGWRDEPLGTRLARALVTTDRIDVANEADLGALAEHRRGAAVGASNVAFISGEVGVGGGLIVDGRPLTGAAGYAGEIGHIPLDPDGLPCRCGSVGCWETRVGEEALLRLAGLPEDGGHAAVDAVIRDAEAGDPRAVAAFEEVGRWLGIGLAGLVNVLDPELVVLGGRFARIHPHIVGSMAAQLERRALPAPRSLVRVVPAELGVDAPLIGAAELAFEPFLSDPATWLAIRAGRPQLASA